MLTLIKTILADVVSLYKNFLHWNISKLIYSIYGILVGVLFSIIPLILFGVFLYFSYLDMGVVASFLLDGNSAGEFWSSLFASPVTSILAGLMLILAATTVYFGIWYGNFFISWLSLKYIDGKQPKYFKKSRYINLAFMKKFAQIMLWILLFMGIVLGIYVLLFIVLVLVFGGVSGVNELLFTGANNLFSILTLLLTAVLSVTLIYYGYRVSFSYLRFIDQKDTSKKALHYVADSFYLTKGWKRLGRFLIVFVLTSLVLSPAAIIGNRIEETRKDLIVYGDFVAVEAEMGKQELQDQLLQTNQQGYEYYSFLSIEYGEMSLDDIRGDLSRNTLYNWIFNILYFLLIYGVFHMVFSSFYVHELKKKK